MFWHALKFILLGSGFCFTLGFTCVQYNGFLWSHLAHAEVDHLGIEYVHDSVEHHHLGWGRLRYTRIAWISLD